MLEFREDVTMVRDMFDCGPGRCLGEGVGEGEDIGRLERGFEMTFEFGIGKDRKSPGAARTTKRRDIKQVEKLETERLRAVKA